MKIKTFRFNDFSENTFVLYDNTKECVIIDAGNYSTEEDAEIVSFIETNDLKPVKLINTHCHIDHILGANFMQKKYKVPFCANPKESFYLEHAHTSAEMFGLKILAIPKIDIELTEKDTITFGNSVLKIVEVPGHTMGHLAFYNETEKVIFTGDVLFKESIGRTDLPGGDYHTLMNSIKNRILTLGDNYIVYPGHGPSTSIAYEKKNNTFLN